MSAAEVLTMAKAEGVALVLVGDRLTWKADHQPPDDLLSTIKANKQELIEVLSAANEPMTPQQIGWITAVSSLLEVSASYLIDDGFIDHYDLEEQMHADPLNVARLIKSHPRWRH